MSQALSALSYQKAAMKAPRALSYLWQASMMRLLIEGAVSLCAWGWVAAASTVCACMHALRCLGCLPASCALRETLIHGVTYVPTV